MIPIRWHLTLLLGLTVGALVLATGLSVIFATKRLLQTQFDETLKAKGSALITAAEVDDDSFEIDLAVQDFAGFGAGGDDYFEVRRANGKRLLRSPSDRKGDLDLSGVQMPTDQAPHFTDGRLADGRPARFYLQRFQPKDDEDGRFRDLHLVVAGPVTELGAQMATLTTVMGAAGILALLILVPIIRTGIRRGLRPLDGLSKELQQLQPNNLHQRLDTTRLPEELAPVASSMNAWLAKLEASFERERRFSSYAAHELRTPLAELKSIAELGAIWPEEATQERSAEMVRVALEMEALLERLFLLSRTDAGQHPVIRKEIDLGESAKAVLDPWRKRAEDSGKRLTETISQETALTDPILWSAILQNLVGNAISHSPAGARIQVEISPGRISVSNPAPQLKEEDLPRLFERFWRKEADRSEGHFGLGLSIVQSAAALLQGRCTAALGESDQLRVEILFEDASSVQEAS